MGSVDGWLKVDVGVPEDGCWSDGVFAVRREPDGAPGVDGEAEPDYEAVCDQVAGLARDIRGWTLAVQVAEAERAHAEALVDAARRRLRDVRYQLAAARAEFERAVAA